MVEKLHGTSRPLFLDEAHRLPVGVLSRVRAIHDMAGGLPVILAGTHQIVEQVTADRVDGRGQLASRCLVYNALEHVMNAEGPGGGSQAGRVLFSKQEIEAYLEGMNVKFDTGGFTLLWAVACLPNHGCLRTV